MDEIAPSLLDMGINYVKIWLFDFATGASDGMNISVEDKKLLLRPFERYENFMETNSDQK